MDNRRLPLSLVTLVFSSLTCLPFPIFPVLNHILLIFLILLLPLFVYFFPLFLRYEHFFLSTHLLPVPVCSNIILCTSAASADNFPVFVLILSLTNDSWHIRYLPCFL
jgi:hypothetical protein